MTIEVLLFRFGADLHWSLLGLVNTFAALIVVAISEARHASGFALSVVITPAYSPWLPSTELAALASRRRSRQFCAAFVALP
jgi:hypothetical protein